MNWKRQIPIHFILFLVILLLTGCGQQSADEPVSVIEETTLAAVSPEQTDGGTVKAGELTALVFVDENVNGRYDLNESPIPHTFVVGQYNVFGDFLRTGVLTDEDGIVTFAADYTDYFEVLVVAPCNYEATTAVNLSIQEADETGTVAIGFRPQAEELGMATVQVQLWQDDYADGVLQDEERPLVDTTVNFNPNLAKLDSNESYAGLLTAQTDANGLAVVQLGNGCDVVWIDALVPARTTKIRPAAIYEEGKIGFNYAPGLLAVRMGFAGEQPEPTPASASQRQFMFENGRSDDPDGGGEWQLLLDSGGYFNLIHTVPGEETDYGIATLLPAENDQLWRLIEAADLPAIPTSISETEPEAIRYTFTLTTNNDTETRILDSTEAQKSKAIQDLLNAIHEIVKSHTGKEIVFGL
jgi:hypothetical protein